MVNYTMIKIITKFLGTWCCVYQSMPFPMNYIFGSLVHLISESNIFVVEQFIRCESLKFQGEFSRKLNRFNCKLYVIVELVGIVSTCMHA